MKRIYFLVCAVLVAFSVTLHSCSSTSISKLEGEWELCWLNDLGDENFYIWVFEGGELTIQVFDPNSPLPQPTQGAKCEYKTSAEFLDAVVEISGLVQSTMHPLVIPQVSNGKWTIDKVTNDYMRIATSDQEGSNGSYVIREFYNRESDNNCRLQ